MKKRSSLCRVESQLIEDFKYNTQYILYVHVVMYMHWQVARCYPGNVRRRNQCHRPD